MGKKKIAILSGSFNPVHIGHIAIGNYVAEFAGVDEVWFVVSPHNPLKQKSDLLSEGLRLKMMEIALTNLTLPFKICDIEMDMPKPSYTINTLNALNRKYPDCEFIVIMGADSLAGIEQWKNYKDILSKYEVWVYPRLGFNADELCRNYNARYISAPVIELSATFLRSSIAEGKNIEAFLPYGVYQFIIENKLYL